MEARQIEGIAARFLQRWANLPAGMFGLRRLGSGATDAAPGDAVPAMGLVFGQHPAMPAPPTPILEVRSLLPHPSMPVPGPDDSQTILAGRIFGG